MKKQKDSQKYKFVDSVAFFEYTKLPGIICDRFLSLFESETYENTLHISEEAFIKVFMLVYLSTLEQKLKLTFKM